MRKFIILALLMVLCGISLGENGKDPITWIDGLGVQSSGTMTTDEMAISLYPRVRDAFRTITVNGKLKRLVIAGKPGNSTTPEVIVALYRGGTDALPAQAIWEYNTSQSDITIARYGVSWIDIDFSGMDDMPEVEIGDQLSFAADTNPSFGRWYLNSGEGSTYWDDNSDDGITDNWTQNAAGALQWWAEVDSVSRIVNEHNTIAMGSSYPVPGGYYGVTFDDTKNDNPHYHIFKDVVCADGKSVKFEFQRKNNVADGMIVRESIEWDCTTAGAYKLKLTNTAGTEEVSINDSVAGQETDFAVYFDNVTNQWNMLWSCHGHGQGGALSGDIDVCWSSHNTKTTGLRGFTYDCYDMLANTTAIGSHHISAIAVSGTGTVGGITTVRQPAILSSDSFGNMFSGTGLSLGSKFTNEHYVIDASIGGISFGNGNASAHGGFMRYGLAYVDGVASANNTDASVTGTQDLREFVDAVFFLPNVSINDIQGGSLTDLERNDRISELLYHYQKFLNDIMGDMELCTIFSADGSIAKKGNKVVMTNLCYRPESSQADGENKVAVLDGLNLNLQAMASTYGMYFADINSELCSATIIGVDTGDATTYYSGFKDAYREQIASEQPPADYSNVHAGLEFGMAKISEMMVNAYENELTAETPSTETTTEISIYGSANVSVYGSSN